MIPEAPFLFSIAGLSASLAGLAGLVAALRRGEGLEPIDLFRLREIVEFAFANVLIAVGTVPAAVALGVPKAVQVGGVVAVVYIVAAGLLLARRRQAWDIAGSPGWYAIAIAIGLVGIGAAVGSFATGSIAVYEVLLMALLARPMLAFLLVLASFDRR